MRAASRSRRFRARIEAEARRTLSDPFACPTEIEEARVVLPDWQPMDADRRDAFDRHVTLALKGLERSCSPEYRNECSAVLARAADIDGARLKELKATRGHERARGAT